MSKKRVLITGGAGFVGSHLADDLVCHGHEVRLLDSLTPRTHRNGERPSYLSPDFELVHGDVRDGAVVERALDGIDVVYHLAAAVGAGESMYEIERCTSVNNVGTAILMDRLMRAPVERLILASSMTVYGEGLYRQSCDASANGNANANATTHANGLSTSTTRVTSIEVAPRTPEQLRRRDWDLRGGDGELLEPIPTPESKTTSLRSVYARSKYDQERMCRQFSRAFGTSIVTLRFFNVFGSRQSLSSPYSGDLATYAASLLNGRAPLVLEDGKQRRDWTHVRDAVSAARRAIDLPNGARAVLNIASGNGRTCIDVARRMAMLLGKAHLEPVITNGHRMGDVRHCFADITRAKKLLHLGDGAGGDNLDAGLVDLIEWVASQTSVTRCQKQTLDLRNYPAELRREKRMEHLS